MAFDPDAPCPYNKMKPCSKVRHKYRGCAKWQGFDFTIVATNETTTRWACSDYWGPVMSREAAQEARGAAAATESFRNQVVALRQEQKIIENQERNDPLLKKILADNPPGRLIDGV